MAEVEDDVEQRAVFIDTNLDTHLVLLVSPTDTFSILKQKILVEHPKSFPDLGEIKISALKVKRRGCYYHLMDSMLVRTAFYGIEKNWFLLADVSSQTMGCCPTRSNVIAIEPSKALPALVPSKDLLESGVDRNEDDHFGNYPLEGNKMLALEEPNKSVPSGVHVESKLMEETQNVGDSSDYNPMEEILYEGELQNNSEKNNKKKRKQEEGERYGVGDENGERVDKDLHIDTVGSDLKLATDVVDEAPPPIPAKKKHKAAKKDARETSPSKSKPVVHDSDRVSPGDENGERLDGGLPIDTVASDLKLASDVADEEAPPPTPAKKKHKAAKKDARATSPSKTKPVVRDSDRVSPGDENGERLDEGLPVDAVGSELASDVADGEAPPPNPAKKKHKTGKKDGQETLPSKKSAVHDSDRVSPESEAAVSKIDQGDIQRRGATVDMNEVPSSGTSKGNNKKRKKEKRHPKSELPAPEVVNKEVPMQTEIHAYNASVESSALLVEDVSINLVKDVQDGDIQRGGATVDMNELPSSGTSKDKNKKRKKEKRHPKSELPGPEVNERYELPSSEPVNKEVPMQIEDHIHNASVESSALLLEDGSINLVKDVQDGADHSAEGISTAKKSKKSKKGDVDRVDESNCPSEIPDVSMVEFEAKPKKKKAKKAKLSTKENMDLSSMENKDPEPSVVSTGGVENGNCDVPDETDRVDATQRTDKKSEMKVKTSSVSPRDGTQEESDTEKISANGKSKGEKAKRKAQKKQVVSISDRQEVSVKEQPDEKMSETDVSEKTNAVVSGNPEIDGLKDQMEPVVDRHEDINNTHMEVSADVSEVKKTHASKRKVKKHDDATKLKDDNGESTQPVHPPPINTDEENTEITGDKPKRGTEKRQNKVEDTPDSPTKEPFDEGTKEMAAPISTDAVVSGNREIDGSMDQMELAGDRHEDSNKTPMEVSADVSEVKKTRASKRKVKKHNDATKLKDDNGQSTEPVHPPPTNTDEENTEITGEKRKKRTEKRQTKLEDPPKLPMKEQFDEGTKEMAAPTSAGVDLLMNVAVSDANHQQELSLRDDNTENLDDIPHSDSASLVGVMNQEKPPSTSKEEIVKNLDHPSSIDTSSGQTGLTKSKKSKESRTLQNENPNSDIPPSDSASLAEVSKEEIVKKLDQPSSIDTSSGQTGLTKSKKRKEGKKASQNGTKLHKPTTEQQHLDMPLTQLSEIHAATPEELIEPQILCPPARKTHLGKTAKETQKKRNESKNRGKVVNASAKKKSLLATRGAIFEDGSSESSDGVDKMEEGSGSSTKTPSDNMSSDYSEGESNGYVVSSRHDASKDGEQDSAKPKFSSMKDLPLHSVLRNSSRYRKAKVVAASQSQLEDSEAVDFVPDSQANL